MLGIDMSAHPSDVEVVKAFESIWSSLGDRRIGALIDLPLITDPDKQAAMEILSRLYIPAYYSDNNLFYLHICHGVDLSLRYGNSAASTYAYGWFGVLLATVFGLPVDGQAFARLAHDLMERYRFLAYKAPVNMFLKFVAYWSQTLDKMIEYSRAMLTAGVETGDVAGACFSFSETILGMISRGDPLSEVHLEAERGLDFVRRAGFRDVFDLITGLDRFVLSMRGQTMHLSTFADDRLSEAEFEARLPEDRMPTLVFFYHAVKLMGRFFFGDFDAALASGKKSRALLWAGLFSVQSHYFYFYYALTLAACFDRFSPEERKEALAVLAAHEAQLREWARNSPPTFHHAHCLVCAEIARITGKELTAMRLYEEAIKSARDHGFVQNEALANELAARFYLERELEKIARTYLSEARSCYLRWEADGKVRQLDERYPWLREEERTAAARIGQVDAIAVVKGTQAISGEIFLVNLLDRLMKIVLENGGAQRGYLLLARGDDLTIEARARVEGQEIKVLQEVSPPLPSVLPLSIINYVRRTRQMVILDDASARHMFSSDEYIVETKPVSVLCLPILRQAHLTGLLYLENDLIRGAFTANRIAVLEVIAAQAAISLENSTLYASLQKAREELEQRVAARTEELSRANAMLQELDRLKSMFIASMSHELRTPLNSVIGFSSLLLEEWFGSLNAEQKENLSIVLRSGKHLLNLINDVIDVSKIEAGKVETVVEEFDVYDILSETVTMVTKDVRDKGLTLAVEVPHCRMRTDRQRLLQCVLNLVGNAVKFTEKGGIHVVARQVQGSQLEDVEPGSSNIQPGKNFLEIFVEDTGVGIKEEDLPKLFYPFARIESPIKAPGTGLGLYLTKKLTTELLEGKISCRSKYGEGSRFALRLPVKIR